MSLILNIDTALDGASVSLANDGTVLRSDSSSEQKDHAAWLHPAIAKMMQEEGRALQDLDAVAVSIGPGSYTGLRVGLAAAKGFCYALDIPLITMRSGLNLTEDVKLQAVEKLTRHLAANIPRPDVIRVSRQRALGYELQAGAFFEPQRAVRF